MSIVCSIKECVCMLFLGRRRAHFYCSLCRVWLCVVGLSRLTCKGFVQGQSVSFVWAYSSPQIFAAAILYRSSSLRWRYKQCLCVFFKKKNKGKPWLSHLLVVQPRDQGSPASGELGIRGVRHQGS